MKKWIKNNKWIVIIISIIFILAIIFAFFKLYEFASLFFASIIALFAGKSKVKEVDKKYQTKLDNRRKSTDEKNDCIDKLNNNDLADESNEYFKHGGL